MEVKTDVLVVGASFAGLALAYSLPQKARVTLVDKKRHLQTASTGLITPPTLELMQRVFSFDIPWKKTFHSMKLVFKGIGQVDLESEQPFMYLLDKEAFFLRALENLPPNVQLFTGSRIERVNRKNAMLSGSSCNATITFDFLVGADGAFSTVARERKLGKVRRWLYGYEWNCHEASWQGILFLVDSSLARGYGAWSFGDGSHMVIGCASEEAVSREQMTRLSKELLDTHCEPTNLRGGIIPVGGPVSVLCRGDTLLVGDAAGLCGPFLGDGMQTAIKSSMIAARALAGGENVCQVYKRALKSSHVLKYVNQQLLLRKVWKSTLSSKTMARFLFYLVHENKDELLPQLNLIKEDPRALWRLLLGLSLRLLE